jgi:hypothetical protein
VADDVALEVAELGEVKVLAAKALAELAAEGLPCSTERRLGVDVRDTKAIHFDHRTNVQGDLPEGRDLESASDLRSCGQRKGRPDLLGRPILPGTGN